MFDWITEIGEAFTTGVDWVKDAVSSVFTSETAIDALTGAAIGGVTAALTGEDVIDGALVGGGIGGIIGAYDSYQKAHNPLQNLPDNATISDIAGTQSEPQKADINLGSMDSSIFNETPDITNSASFDAIGTEPLFASQPASDIALYGLNDNNVAAAQSKYNFVYTPTETKNVGLLSNVKSKWSNLSEDMKSDIVSGAIKGGAGYLLAKEKARSDKDQLKELEKMRRESDRLDYERTKSKVGNTKGLIPTFTINQTSYNNNRLNPAR